MVSLFASAVRMKLWPSLFKSLKGTSVNYEVIFCGNNSDYYKDYPRIERFNNKLIYIKTENIKPSQCYEIARRNCTGEVVVWIADDCEFVGDIIGKAYAYWKSKNNKKLILSLQTKESGYGQKNTKLYDMKEHTFFSTMPETPLMAPIAMMSREFLNELGGIDQRYVAGQYENDIVLRAYAQDAIVEIFGDETCYVDIDHLKKSIDVGESTDEESFRERPFAKGYEVDRQVLENSWTTFNQVEAFKILQSGQRPFSLRKMSPIQLDQFMPYQDYIPLTHSINNKGIWD